MQKNGYRFLIIAIILILAAGCNSSRGTPFVNPGEGMQVATLSGKSSASTQIPAQDNGPFILLQDDFSSPGSGWEIADGEYGRTGYEQGGYLVEAITKDEYNWGVAGVNYDDVRIDVDVAVLQTNNLKNDGFGIDCRLQENGDGYGFRISSDGYIGIVLFADMEPTSLLEWVESDAVYTDDRINHLTAICEGNHFSFLVNDVNLADVVDDTFTSGDIALSAISFETEPVSVLFDNIIVQQLGNPYVYADRTSYSLAITNPTQSQACYVYVVPSTEEFWGSNLLSGEEKLDPGETATINDLADSVVDVKVDTCQNVRLFEGYEIDLSETLSIMLIEPQLLNHEDFENLNGWTSGVVDGGMISNSNGDYYSISVIEGDKLVTGTGNFKAENVIMLTDASMVKTGAGSMGIYGITCRMQPDNSGIFFAVRGDGSASISKIVNGNLVFLTEWKYSDYVYQGIDSNYIEGDCIGSTYTMYVNGDYIDSAEDTDFTSGYAGTAVFSPPGATTQADFDFVDVYLGY